MAVRHPTRDGASSFHYPVPLGIPSFLFQRRCLGARVAPAPPVAAEAPLEGLDRVKRRSGTRLALTLMAEAPPIVVPPVRDGAYARPLANGTSATGGRLAPAPTVERRTLGAPLKISAYLPRQVNTTGAAVTTLESATLTLLAPSIGAKPSRVAP